MKLAILVIDVQRALFDPLPRPHAADAVVQRIHGLCERGRKAGVPIVWIQHENSEALAHASQGWQLVEGLVAEDADVLVRKQTPDAFLGTQLAEHLHQRGIQQLIIAGYATEFCVDTTVRRAASLGWEVVIVSDAHTTHDKPHATAAWICQHHNHTLPAMRSFGVKITALASDCVKLQDHGLDAIASHAP